MQVFAARDYQLGWKIFVLFVCYMGYLTLYYMWHARHIYDSYMCYRLKYMEEEWEVSKRDVTSLFLLYFHIIGCLFSQALYLYAMPRYCYFCLVSNCCLERVYVHTNATRTGDVCIEPKIKCWIFKFVYIWIYLLTDWHAHKILWWCRELV